ncbi:MAG: ribosome silencing factor [Deltaproteobacteria bacterium]|nr:ribosome silencing factor [Deltaproteobacteria bacterium]
MAKKSSGNGGRDDQKREVTRKRRAANPAKRSPREKRARAYRRDRAAKKAFTHSRELALATAEIGLEMKALNIEIIDVRGKVDYSDYIVVMSGRSDRQVGAIADRIQQDLLRKHAVRCIGVEGMPHGSWVLMDYGDVIVHIFHEDTRGYYDLESLWIDAARVSIE